MLHVGALNDVISIAIHVVTVRLQLLALFDISELAHATLITSSILSLINKILPLLLDLKISLL